MRKLIDKLLRLVLLLILLILAGVFYLLFTESGSRNLERLAMHYLPQLSIEDPSGKILGDYRIGRLRWNEEAVSIDAVQFHLASDFSAIFRKEIRVLTLELETLALNLHLPEQPEETVEESAEAPAGISLPVKLALDQLSVKRLELDLNGQQYVVDDIHLAGVMSGSDIRGTEVMLRSEFEGRPVAAKLSGDIGLAWPPAFDLEAGIDATDPLLGAVEAVADLEGSLHDYRIAATVAIASESLGSNSLRLAATGNESELVVESARLEGDNGNADLSGRLQWQELLAWQAELALEELDSTNFYPDYPARLSGRVTTSGRLEQGEPQLEINLQAIEGLLLNEFPLSAGGQASYAAKRLEVRELEIAAGENVLRVNGRLAEQFDLAFELQAHHPEQLLPQLQGKLSASGSLGGNLEAPLLTAEISAEIVLDLSTDAGEVTGDGKLRSLKFGDQQLASAEFQASGNLQEHRVDLTAVHELASLTTALAGGWSDERWQGDLEKLDIDGKQAGRWGLRQPVALNLSAALAEAEELCLESGETAACVDFHWEKARGMRSAGKVSKLQLALLDIFLPPAARLRGEAGLDYEFLLVDETPEATAAVSWGAGKLQLTGEPGDSRTFGYDAGNIDVVLENQTLAFNGGLVLTGYASVDGKGEIQLSPEDGKHTIDASLAADAPDLTWLNEFIPEARLLKGSLAAEATAIGTFPSPAFTVEAQLQDGQLLIERTEETIDDISLRLETIADNRFGIDGSLKAGEGILTTKGEMKLEGTSWSTWFDIGGGNLRLIDSHEVKVLVSPDIRIEANPQKVIISGTLVIPEAALRLTTLPKSAIPESDDVIILGKGSTRPPPPGEGLGFEPRLNVVLGEKVTFSGYGLDARLTGDFRILQVKESLLTDGVLTIRDGTYSIYEQVLEIETGQLIFNGPMDNPGMDIRIVREVDDVTVGMNVSGTLQRPTSNIFSNPAMSDTEAFSYLLLGRSLDGASSGDGAMLLNVAKTLGPRAEPT
ncbi:MAG: translocation/assembly module TamB domain-containing protein [Gammaproteobacteria bacterium]